MSYVFEAVMLVLFLACAVMAEAFWSGLHNEKGLSRSLFKSIATGAGFVIYAAIDYLMIVPGANYLMV